MKNINPSVRSLAEARSGTYVVVLARGDVHHSGAVRICKDVWGNSRSSARPRRPRS